MPEAVSRKARLRGTFRLDGRSVFHPPWALLGERFSELCDASGKCRETCPEGILVAGADGVGFGNGECIFREDCVKACPTGALFLYGDDRTERRAPRELAVGGGRCPLSTQHLVPGVEPVMGRARRSRSTSGDRR